MILPPVTSYKDHGPGVLRATENLLGDVDDDPEVVRDRRDSTAGFVSYGFGVFGGYRSGYGRRGNRDRRDRGQAGDGSGGAGGHKSSTTDGLAGWWKILL